jgi:hypothetical protein
MPEPDSFYSIIYLKSKAKIVDGKPTEIHDSKRLTEHPPFPDMSICFSMTVKIDTMDTSIEKYSTVKISDACR